MEFEYSSGSWRFYRI